MVPVKVIAFIAVRAGHDEAFLGAAMTCRAASRAEPGVLRYDLWREEEGEQRFVFDELYVDRASVQAHMASGHFAAFGSAIRDWTVDASIITVAYPVEVAD